VTILAFMEGVGLRRIWSVRWVMGVYTYLWTDGWLREVPSCARFIWLFYLLEDRWVLIVDMFTLGWDEGGEA
jgi:hypothetical protein